MAVPFENLEKLLDQQGISYRGEDPMILRMRSNSNASYTLEINHSKLLTTNVKNPESKGLTAISGKDLNALMISPSIVLTETQISNLLQNSPSSPRLISEKSPLFLSQPRANGEKIQAAGKLLGVDQDCTADKLKYARDAALWKVQVEVYIDNPRGSNRDKAIEIAARNNAIKEAYTLLSSLIQAPQEAPRASEIRPQGR